MEYGMAKWEEYVRDNVNLSVNLSFNYEELEKEHSEIYEFLVGYYSKEEERKEDKFIYGYKENDLGKV